jgi:tetratricopeptide (TPR) repeat protein
VLSNPERRRQYEENHEAPETDADRIAEAEASFRRGEVLLRAGNFRGALELLERAVMLWPDEAEYQAALAWALHRKTPPERERAWNHFERALALGEQAVWLLRASLVARELGNEARAAEFARRARELDPQVKA